MRRHTARPYGQSATMMRLASMLMAVVVLWALYERLKDPGTWRLLTEEKLAFAEKAENKRPVEPEVIVAGANDQDESEVAAIQDLLERVNDRAPLKPREMDAYWRLMDWSRSQSFDSLEQRARHDVAFTQLWEQPEKYRGKPVRLQMHIRRVLQYDSPENPSNIATVCEAWGWTDESRSFPYVVVFADPPAGLPIGTDVRAEIEFVGYFLKIMSYTAFDHARGAPLFVGRARLSSASPAAEMKSQPTDPRIVGGILAGGMLFVAWTFWSSRRTRNSPSRKVLPTDLSPMDSANPGSDDGAFSMNEIGHPPADQGGPLDLQFSLDEDDRSSKR